MHVLHVIDGLGLGGAERMAVDIANATARAGLRVSFCITRAVDGLSSELAAQIDVLRLDRRWRYELAPVLRLMRYVRREHVDVVHVHMRSSMALLLPLRAIGVLARPIVFHDHYGTIEEDLSVPRWFRLGRRWIDVYVGVSPLLGTWARDSGMPADRVQVIENAIDLRRFAVRRDPARLRAELGLGPDTKLGLIVANVRHEKGIETAIEAIAKARHGHRVHLAVAGALAEPPYLASLRALAVKHGLERRLTFLGPRDDVPQLLGGCDFALSASHTESGPLVLIEFMSAGVPFVATRVGDIGHRLAAAGIPGFVPPRDPGTMAVALDELLGLSTGQGAERTARGRALLVEFDFQHVLPRWLDVYDRAKRQ